MQFSKSTFAMFVGCLGLAGPTFAQQDAETDNLSGFYPAHELNAFYVNYKVIDDHPACNAPAETAFRISVNLENLNFSVQGLPQDVIDHTNLENDEPQVCVRTERRALDTIEIEVPCPVPEEDIIEIFETVDLAAQLDVSFEAQACLSPDRTESLGGSWSATLRQANSVTTRSGGVHASNLSSDVVGATNVAYVGVLPFISSFQADGVLESYSDREELLAPSLIFFSISCVPFSIEALGNETYNIGIETLLLLSSLTPDFCANPACRTKHSWLKQLGSLSNCGGLP